MRKVILLSKVYICSRDRYKRVIGVLEVPTTVAAKEAYDRIKASIPDVSIGVYGARDLATLRRTQRTLDTSKVFKTLPEFIEQILPKQPI
jgi:hypothetical protein